MTASSSRRSVLRRAVSTVVESLEQRQLLTASLNQTTHLLTVTGTSSSENIVLTTVSGGIDVTFGTTSQGTFSGVTSIAINAGGGNDTVSIASTINKPATVNGGDGEDSIAGGAGNDSLTGGNGNDTLIGGLGSDRMIGGAGTNTVDYSARTANITVSMDSIFNDGEANEHDFVDATTIQVIIGGSGFDTLSGSSALETLYGNAGNDSLIGAAGNDLLIGGTGNDTLEAGDGNDTTFGESGNDSVDGGTGNDSLSGGDGNDTIYGGPGNDTLAGDAGEDALYGDGGNDLIIVTAGGADNINGGGGLDLAQTDVSDTSSNVELAGSISGATTVPAGSDYTLTLTATGTSVNKIVGWSINWGDGTAVETLNTTSSVVTATHKFMTFPKAFNISASVRMVPSAGADVVYLDTVALALDSTFGKSGVIQKPVSNGLSGAVRLSDGRFVVGVPIYQYGTIVYSIRAYNPSSSNSTGAVIDTTFGTGGQTNFAGWGNNIAVDSQGRIIFVMSEDDDYANSTVWWINSDGSIRGSYALSTDAIALCLAIDEQDNVIVIDGNKRIYRIKPNMSNDSSFANGTGSFTYNDTVLDPMSLSIAPSGQYIVATGGGFSIVNHAGTSVTNVSLPYSTTSAHVVAALADGVLISDGNALKKYSYTGSLIPTFGTSGVVTLSSDVTLTKIKVLPDGRIIVGGKKSSYLFAQQFTNTGAVDFSFGVNGRILVATGVYQDTVRDILVDADGRPLIFGDTIIARIGYLSTTAPIPLNAPSDVIGTADSPVQVSLSWTSNSTTQTGYAISWVSEDGLHTGTAASTAASKVITGLKPSTKYRFSVKATGVIDSAWATSDWITTPRIAPPLNFSVSQIGTSSLQLSWTDNSNVETGFKVYKSENGGTYNLLGNIAGSTALNGVITYPVTGLTPGANYSFIVTAYNSYFESASTAPVSATTEMPTGLQLGIDGPDSGKVGTAAKFTVAGESVGTPVYIWSLTKSGKVIQTARGAALSYVPQEAGTYHVRLTVLISNGAPRVFDHDFSVAGSTLKPIKINGNPTIEVGNLSVFSISAGIFKKEFGNDIYPTDDEPPSPKVVVQWTVTPENASIAPYTSNLLGFGVDPIELIYSPADLGNYSISVIVSYMGQTRLQGSIVATATEAASDNTIRNLIGNNFFGVSATDIMETADGHILVAGPSLDDRGKSYGDQRGPIEDPPPNPAGTGFTVVRLDGELQIDTSFGIAGYLNVRDIGLTPAGYKRFPDQAFAEGSIDYTRWNVSIAEQASKSIVVATEFYDWENDRNGWLVARYNEDGTPDLGFGDGGRRELFLPEYDGGTQTGGYENAWAALSRVGEVAIQKDFDQNGTVTEHIIIAGGARREVGGSDDMGVGAITRLGTDGEVDASFGQENGWHIFGNEADIHTYPYPESPFAVGHISSIAFQRSNGPGVASYVTGIVLGGETTDLMPGHFNPARWETYKHGLVISRLNIDGTLDTNSDGTAGSFGPNGQGFVVTTLDQDEIAPELGAETNFIFHPSAFVRSIDIDQAGHIYAMGNAGWWQREFGHFTLEHGGTRYTYAIVARYSADGVADTSFGDLVDPDNESLGKKGRRVMSFYGQDYVTSGHVTADGHIVLVGNSINGGMIVRLNNDGTVDETFGPGGRQTINRDYTLTLPENSYHDGYENYQNVSHVHDMWASAFVTHDGDILVTGYSGRLDVWNFDLEGGTLSPNPTSDVYSPHLIPVARYHPKELNVASLVATATQEGPVRLHWDDVSGSEDGFVIRRVKAGADLNQAAEDLDLIASEIGFAGRNETDYLDTSAEPNTRYVYRVYAYASMGTFRHLGGKTNDAVVVTSSSSDGYVLQDSFQLPVNSPAGVDSHLSLEAGQTYLITVRGQFYLHTNTLPSVRKYGDSEYGWGADGIRRSPSYYDQDNPIDLGVAINDTEVDMLKYPYWGDPATDKDSVYSISHTPSSTGTIHFNFYDIVYNDNSSGTPITVEIYRALPAAPTGLVADTDRENKRINLSWKNSAGSIKRVVVQRSINDADFVNIASLPGTMEAYTDSSIILNQLYTYRVKIENEFGLSRQSNLAYVTVINQVPEIAEIPLQYARVGSEFQIGIAATDPDGDSANLTYTLVGVHPTSMEIDSLTGRISGWTPTGEPLDLFNHLGAMFFVGVRVTDADGGTKDRFVQISVLPDPSTLPQIIQEATATLEASEHKQIQLYVVAALPDGTDPASGDSLFYEWETIVRPKSTGIPTFQSVPSTSSNATNVEVYGAGHYRFRVKAYRQSWSGGQTQLDPWPAISEVEIDVAQYYTQVKVTPSAAILAPGKNQRFKALAVDQFAHAMPEAHSFTWSIVSSTGAVPGTIDANGLYTAPATTDADFADIVLVQDASDSSKIGYVDVQIVDYHGEETIEEVPNSFQVEVLSFSELRLSILGQNPSGPESEITYTWEVVPPTGGWQDGRVAPRFTKNGKNDAKETTLICDQSYSLNYKVKILMRNATGIEGEVIYDLTGDVRDLSSIELTPGNAIVETGKSVTYHAIAKDQYDRNLSTQPTFRWVIDGVEVTTVTGPDYTFSALMVEGAHTIDVSATVGTNTKQRIVSLQVVGQQPPVLLISGFGGTKDEPTPIEVDTWVKIIADDPNDGDPVTWRLWARDSDGNRTKLAEGNTPVGKAPATADKAVVLRAASLKNGDYTLELTATDDPNEIPADVKYFRLHTEFKLGSLNLPFTDGQIEVPGAEPLTATRVYDSMTKDVSGDFGYGWQLQIEDTGGRTTARPGKFTNTSNPIPAFRSQDLVYLTTPDGQEHAFMFAPKKQNPNEAYPLPGISTFLPQFVAVDGSVAKLTTEMQITDGVYTGPVVLRQDTGTQEWYYSIGGGSASPENGFNPAKSKFGNRYFLKNDDGTLYTFDGSGNLLSGEDGNGHITTYGNLSAQGRQFAVLRETDAQGREHIVGISDSPDVTIIDGSTPLNLYVGYTYDADGDLVEVRDRSLQVTTFEYQKIGGVSTHRLIKIIDPRGVDILGAHYDPATGQLDKLTDSAGKATTVKTGEFDGETSPQVVTDSSGSTSESVYNDHGDVIREIKQVRNAQGVIIGYQVTVRDYVYGGSNALAMDQANRFGITNLNKLFSSSAYLPFTISGQDTAGVRYTRQPASNTLAHDVQYNIIDGTDNYPELNKGIFQPKTDSVRGADGSILTTQYLRYFAPGKPSIIKDPYGNLTWNLYDTHGNPTHTINSQGEGSESVYDSDGRVIATYRATGTGGTESALPSVTRGVLLGTTAYYESTDTETDKVVGKVKSTTNSDGVTTRYTYWTSGSAYGQVKDVYREWTENGSHSVHESHTDYDSAGRSKTVTDVNGKTTSTSYDTLGQAIVTTDQYGGKTIQTYDRRGLLIRTLFADGTETRTSYDNLGRAEWTSDRFASVSIATVTVNTTTNIATVTYTNDNAPSYLVTRNIYDSLGRVVGTERYKNAQIAISVDGTLYKTVGPGAAAMQINGQRLSATSTKYDSQGRVSETTSATGLQSGTIYYLNGQTHYSGIVVTAATQPVGSLPFGEAAGTYLTQYTEYKYDQTGSDILGLIPDAVRYDEVIDAKGQKTRTLKDAYGRSVGTVFDDDSFTQTDYTGSFGSVVRSYEQGTSAAVYTERRYDVAGRLTDVYLPPVDDALTTSTELVRPHWQYTYDANGNQLTQVDPRGRTTTFGYSEKNQPTSRTLPPDSDGNTANDVETWTYDAFGRIKTRTDFKGQTTAYAYSTDSRYGGRLEDEYRFAVGVAALDGSGNIRTAYAQERTHYGYDSLGRQETVVEYANGNLNTAARTTTSQFDSITGGVAQVVSPEGTINRAFDPVTGRLVRTWTSSNETDYGYDPFGRLENVYAVVVSGVRAATFSYFDRSTDEPVFTGGNPSKTNYSYNAVGSIETITQPNGVVTTYVYDDMNRLDLQTVTKVGATLASYDYVLLANGQRDYVLETNAAGNTTKIDWAYDANGRLTQEKRDEGNDAVQNGGDYTDTYAFDLAGNRVSKSHDAVGASNDSVVLSQYNDRDQLKKSGVDDNANGTLDLAEVDSTYDYDSNGSITAETNGGVVKKYLWDLRNRMTGFDANGDGDTADNGDATYTYNQDGIRISTQLVGETPAFYLIDAQNPTGYPKPIQQSATQGGTPTLSYVLGADIIAQSDGTTIAYFIKDGHGTTRALTNSSGVVIERYDFDGYGNKINYTTGSGAALAGDPLTVWLQPDGYRDFTTGLDRNGVRDFASSLGRGWTIDPRGEVRGDTLNSNLYAYASGNPIYFTDPTGMFISELLVSMGNGALKFATTAYRSYKVFKTTKTALHSWRITLAAINGVLEAMGNPDLTTGRLDPQLARRIGFIAGFTGGVVNQYYSAAAGTAVTSLMRDNMNEFFDDRPFSWRSVAQISFNAIASTATAYGLEWYGRQTGALADGIGDDPKEFLHFFLEMAIQWEADTIFPAVSETFIRYLDW